MKASVIGKGLLVWLLIDLMARPCCAMPNYSGSLEVKPQRQSTVLIASVIVLAIAGYMLWKLAQLCQHVFPNPPKPPPSTNAAPASVSFLSAGGSSTTKPLCTIVCTPSLSSIGVITDQTPDFQDPEGGYYNRIMQLTIVSSPDLQNWSPEGTATAWFNDNYLLLAQYDSNGNQVSLTIYPNTWHNPGSQIELKFTEQPQKQLYYKIQ